MEAQNSVMLGLGEPNISRPSRWLAVVDTVERLYQDPDIDGLQIVCAAVAAHALKDYPPAWCLIIAPPGSMKTDVLESFRGLPGAHFVDEVTPKTFISGKIDEPGKKGKRKAPASLLHRIGSDGFLIAADFSTFSSNTKTLGAIVSQLRRIYDGNFSREFGSEENLDERSWTGRLTLLAGGTPDVDKHYQLFQSLGERFLRVRWNRAGGTDTGLRAMQHDRSVAVQLKAVMHDLLQPILSAPQDAPTIHPAILRRIAALSEFIALARSYVERDRFTREQTGITVTEGNTRLPQQLAQIARGLALLDGRTEVTDEDYRLVVRAAFDSLLPTRAVVLKRIAQTGKPYTVEANHAAIERAIGDLQAAGYWAKTGVLVSKQKCF